MLVPKNIKGFERTARAAARHLKVAVALLHCLHHCDVVECRILAQVERLGAEIGQVGPRVWCSGEGFHGGLQLLLGVRVKPGDLAELTAKHVVEAVGLGVYKSG